jgi:hypothetical protein
MPWPSAALITLLAECPYGKHQIQAGEIIAFNRLDRAFSGFPLTVEAFIVMIMAESEMSA